MYKTTKLNYRLFWNLKLAQNLSGENREIVTQGLDALIPVDNKKKKVEFADPAVQKKYEH